MKVAYREKRLAKGMGGASADLRQEFAQPAKSSVFKIDL